MPTLTRAALQAAAREAGFHRAGIVDAARLARWSAGVAARAPAWMQPGWVMSPDWSRGGTALVCALSCARREPDDASQPGDPHALIAPFARRNHYRAAAAMMRRLLKDVGTREGFAPRSGRIFVNSQIPEKPFLAASGMGAYGKNSLTIIPGLGSLFVIAGCILPVACAGEPAPEAHFLSAPEAHFLSAPEAHFSPCGSCTRCIDACPVGAIVEPGIVDPHLCLQGLAEGSALLAPSVMGKWGRRLYGCQDCQDACPHNAGLDVAAPSCPGEVGASVSIRRILLQGIEGVRGMFRGTPMGMSRVHPAALIRNALIAAGNSGESSLRGCVRDFLDSPDPVLRGTARWALENLG